MQLPRYNARSAQEASVRSFAVLLLFVTVALSAAAQAAPPRACGAWDALIGAWEADPDSAAPGSTGWSTFQREVQDKVIVRRNRAEYPATKDKPASVHDDLMVIYEDPSGPQQRATYWDNEGHVIRYLVSTSSDGCVLTLVTEPATSGPRFRLTYTSRGPDSVTGLFEIAAPATPDAFKKYLQWTMHRRPAKTQ